MFCGDIVLYVVQVEGVCYGAVRGSFASMQACCCWYFLSLVLALAVIGCQLFASVTGDSIRRFDVCG